MDSKEIRYILKVDTRTLAKTERKLKKFTKAVEKANSLAEELAGKEVHVEITTQQKSHIRNVGRCFSRWIQKYLFRIQDRYKEGS